LIQVAIIALEVELAAPSPRLGVISIVFAQPHFVNWVIIVSLLCDEVVDVAWKVPGWAPVIFEEVMTVLSKRYA
jgi:hypothetical protein